jgi:hypothetical protein
MSTPRHSLVGTSLCRLCTLPSWQQDVRAKWAAAEDRAACLFKTIYSRQSGRLSVEVRQDGAKSFDPKEAGGESRSAGRIEKIAERERQDSASSDAWQDAKVQTRPRRDNKRLLGASLTYILYFATRVHPWTSFCRLFFAGEKEPKINLHFTQPMPLQVPHCL